MKPKNSLWGFLNTAVLLCSNLLLIGCASLAPTQESTLTRTLKISSPDATLLKEAQYIFAQTENLYLIPEDGDAEFTLILQHTTTPENPTLFTAKPRIIGRLEQRPKTTHFALKYALLNFKGTPIKTEEVVGIGEDKVGYFPSLNASLASPMDESALKDTLYRLHEEVKTTIRSTPFKAPVRVVAAEKAQVAIPVHAQAKLQTRHVFVAEDAPETTLRFISLIDILGGQTPHALLQLESGDLPALGDILILRTP